MAYRRLMRQYHGTYAPSSKFRTFWCVGFLMWTFGLLGVSTSGAFNVSIDYSQNAFSFLLTGVLLYGALKAVVVVRWCLYWLVIAITVTVFIDGDPDLTKTGLDETNAQLRFGVLSWLIAMEIITVSIWFLVVTVYPWAVKTGTFLNTLWWWRIRPHPGKGKEGSFLYRPSKFWTKSHRQFGYQGDLDEEGRPHGLGKWEDSSPHGESLFGHWQNGVPVGPFRSHEHNSGYSFVGVRVAWADSRMEEDWTTTKFMPENSKDRRLRWGVASVECSVSGAFFKNLPTATVISGPDVTKDASWCIKQLLHAHDMEPVTSVVVSTDGNGLRVSGHSPNDDTQRGKVVINVEASTSTSDIESLGRMSKSAGPRLQVSGWQSTTSDENYEALVLIPGFNCPMKDAIERMGTFLSMSDLPPNIKVFVFGWPAGQVLSYFQAAGVGAQGEGTKEMFAEFLRSLVAAGVKQVHILAHSMGAKVFLGALEQVKSVLGSTGGARMATCVLMNPDAFLDSFVAGWYDEIRSMCDHVTLYADCSDGALFWSEVVNGRKALGKNPFDLKRGGDDEEGPVWLDMDVIDTTFMDANVHTIRHNYFNLNRWVVDDLREIILTRKRAVNRESRMMQRNERGNVYNFLAAPGHIVND
ncbi:hypothetical protein TrST_g9537 [Triparma strigata]|nr:hypothetical protein TrST_g9537 [Triparma strigata]